MCESKPLQLHEQGILLISSVLPNPSPTYIAYMLILCAFLPIKVHKFMNWGRGKEKYRAGGDHLSLEIQIVTRNGWQPMHNLEACISNYIDISNICVNYHLSVTHFGLEIVHAQLGMYNQFCGFYVALRD